MKKELKKWGARGAGIPVLLLALIFVFSPENVTAQEDCLFKIGYDIEPPYAYPGKDGKIIGIDADILRAVSKDIGCNIEFLERPWKRTLAEVKSGLLDATFGASYKDERAKFAHYSLPYRGQPHVIFEHTKKASEFTSLKDYLNGGKTLGVVLGWHYTNDIRKILDDPAYESKIEVAPDIDSLYRMHARGRVDGFLANPSQVAGTFGKETLNIKFNMIRADVDILHFLFSKNTVKASQAERMNKHMAERIKGGFFLEVCKKYEDQLVSWCKFLSTADKIAAMGY